MEDKTDNKVLLVLASVIFGIVIFIFSFIFFRVQAQEVLPQEVFPTFKILDLSAGDRMLKSGDTYSDIATSSLTRSELLSVFNDQKMDLLLRRTEAILNKCH